MERIRGGARQHDGLETEIMVGYGREIGVEGEESSWYDGLETELMGGYGREIKAWRGKKAHGMAGPPCLVVVGVPAQRAAALGSVVHGGEEPRGGGVHAQRVRRGLDGSRWRITLYFRAHPDALPRH